MSDMYPKNIDKAAEIPWKKGTKMGGMQPIKDPVFRPGRGDPSPLPPGFTEYRSKDGDTIWVMDKK